MKTGQTRHWVGAKAAFAFWNGHVMTFYVSLKLTLPWSSHSRSIAHSYWEHPSGTPSAEEAKIHSKRFIKMEEKDACFRRGTLKGWLLGSSECLSFVVFTLSCLRFLIEKVQIVCFLRTVSQSGDFWCPQSAASQLFCLFVCAHHLCLPCPFRRVDILAPFPPDQVQPPRCDQPGGLSLAKLF